MCPIWNGGWLLSAFTLCFAPDILILPLFHFPQLLSFFLSCAVWRPPRGSNGTVRSLMIPSFYNLPHPSSPPVIEYRTSYFPSCPSLSFFLTRESDRALWNGWRHKRLPECSKCWISTQTRFGHQSGLAALITDPIGIWEVQRRKVELVCVSSILKSLRTSRTVAMATVIQECHGQNSNTTPHSAHRQILTCFWVRQHSWHAFGRFLVWNPDTCLGF